MKNLLILLILAVSFIGFSQNANLEYNQTFIEYSGNAGDTVRGATGTWAYEIKKLATNRVYASVFVDIDAQLGTNRDTFFLQSRLSRNEAWTNRDTIIFTGSVDVTIRLAATVRPYEAVYHRIYVKAALANTRIKINKIHANFLY